MRLNKKVLYGAITYCLIIGVIYVILSVLAWVTQSCNIDTKNSPFFYMLYLMYFRGNKCRMSVDWSVFHDDKIIYDLYEVSSGIGPPYRTNIFMGAYLTLHLALIGACLIVYRGIKLSLITRRNFFKFFAPWLGVLIAIIVCDALATIFYVFDLKQVSDYRGLRRLLELSEHSGSTELDTDGRLASDILSEMSSFLRHGPPLFMILVTSQLIVFWFFNIVLCVLAAKHGKLLAAENDEAARRANMMNLMEKRN